MTYITIPPEVQAQAAPGDIFVYVPGEYATFTDIPNAPVFRVYLDSGMDPYPNMPFRFGPPFPPGQSSWLDNSDIIVIGDLIPSRRLMSLPYGDKSVIMMSKYSDQPDDTLWQDCSDCDNSSSFGILSDIKPPSHNNRVTFQEFYFWMGNTGCTQ